MNSNNEENSGENNSDNVFCVSATDAKHAYFLDASDLKSLEYKAVAGRYYGGNFKLYKPSDLEKVASEKHGKDILEAKRFDRAYKFFKEEERQEETYRKQHVENLRATMRSKLHIVMPKNPTPAYQFYCRDKRNSVKQAHPQASGAEVTKILAQQWKNTPMDERKEWNDKASEEKKQHAANKARCEAFLVWKDQNPTLYKTAFELYQQEAVRNSNKTPSHGHLFDQFRNLAPDEKKVYEDMAVSDKKRFDAEAKAWIQAGLKKMQK